MNNPVKDSASKYPASFNLKNMPVRYLKGVGPKAAECFYRRNIRTVQDVIYWYPRAYRDQRMVHDFSQLVHGTHVTVYGEVMKKKVFPISRGRIFYEMIIKTSGGWIACKYFRLPYRGYFDSIEIGSQVKASGRVTYYKNQPELQHPDIHPFNENETEEDQLIPLYPELEKLSQHKVRKIIKTAFDFIREKKILLEDPLPEWLKKENNLMDKMTALEKMHQPDPQLIQDYLQFRSPAQKRMIFEEFFYLQLYMGLKKAGLEKEQTYPMKGLFALQNRVKKEVPFTLTRAQERVLGEISRDLQKSCPMHRLVQGDVGCGKTVVALLACCQVMENRFQCAMMTPTEILAEQHYKNACALLEPLGIRISLLTGKLKAREKRSILEKLATGYSSLCIGTHALIQEAVQFHRLGLVIVDEQHRFGVNQRNLLKQKGVSPHFLVMTATPIPRSLAMTLYGDLDVSVIDELPKGRISILTKYMYPDQREKLWGFAETQIQQGRQVYIVYPLVEESASLDLKNAVAEYEMLQKRFSHLKLGLLHGRMNVAHKQEIMSQFVKGHIHILVSTTVIEVGVDVPNANIMIIENAERFGLSQLHQLRGRVGRGAHKSYCLLVPSKNVASDALSRLSLMEKTQDGFKIAEHDLETRGPGEFLGTRQSGLPEFKIANLIRDSHTLQAAKTSAKKLIEADGLLEQPEHQAIKKEIDHISTRLFPG